MPVPLAAVWVPTAVGVTLVCGLLGMIVLWIWSDPSGPDGDGEDSDQGGGGGARRRPRRPPPTGPVSWQDFERQFAAYVERRSRFTGDCERDGERASNETGDARRPA